ncbi:MAG TPA: ATP-binding protein [Verrucomicrobiota bacterium]|jgi:MinD superfamily P-loop ATPase|nr:ATP-binding protein [Verrucomicrobiota bacterium]OQC25811.1 MAG: NADH dehydrogenase subunit I [Verrucomicrobia bacterium ADurb.Bin063]HCL92609.1 (4Fe-4S)-binding protein [Limisphaerales bacterium]HRR64967.1 ATP-binding protein [Candidatus Paceibacterota bacterium]MBP8015933.1 ATP-binding protein [Verrucomicrobiota bacterium]
MTELVVLSGKGGTGKTSVTASLAALAEAPVLADCDVDASNLPLVLAPRIQHHGTFSSGLRARIQSSRCSVCGQCEELCRFNAISYYESANDDEAGAFRVDPIACEGCGVCAHFCPEGALEMIPSDGGEWFLSETRLGPLVHARLRPGQGNSGKLAALVREKARETARANGRELVLIDGPPGIGCPVIASMTGATNVLVVTEPTVAGKYDLERILALIRHFNLPVSVCINKYDLNSAMVAQIERYTAELGATTVGRIPYDPAVTAAQRRGISVVELNQGQAAPAIVELWKTLSEKCLNLTPGHYQPISAG